MALAADIGWQLRLDLRVVEAGRRGAFGYSPGQWPSARMFGEPVTPKQIRMTGIKARERGIAVEALPFLRALILNAYEVSDVNSRGNACLFIDWLMNADEYAVDEAVQAASCYDELTYGEPRRDRGAA